MQTKLFTTRSGRELAFTPLGLGTAPLGDLFRKLGEVQASSTISDAYRAGIRLFDTSPHYGNGLAEARCGAALRDFPRDSFMFSTKVGRCMDPFTPVAAPRTDVVSPGFAGGFPHRAAFDYSYDGTMRSVEQSLLRTGFDRIDILLIHDCDAWTHGVEGADAVFGQAMEGSYKALDRLRSDGSIKAIGVGLNDAAMSERFIRTGDFDLVLLAGRYSLLEQPALDSFLPTAQERGVGVMLAGVFNSGILASGTVPGAKYNYAPASADIIERVRRIEKLCRQHGVSLRQAALRFPAGHPAAVTLLLGAEAPAEITANAADVESDVPAALWADLKREGLLAAEAPRLNWPDTPPSGRSQPGCVPPH